MDSSLLNGLSSYLLTGQGSGINAYLANPYLSGVYSSALLSRTGISDVFQSGVRFGQALEKAAQKHPESAEQLQEIIKEAMSQSSGKTSGAGSTRKSTPAAVYEPFLGNTQRVGGQLEDYLAGRRASRQQQRQAARQH